jgi:2-polyprenyl-3-methyl-5-hydroxy-6-metoxy-1,4-benzoquinol methylase
MKSLVKKVLKQVFWRVVRRSFILSPKVHVVGELGDYMILSVKEPSDRKQYLPMRYNYHTSKAWKLRYDIRGDSSGLLSYKLKTPDGNAFAEASWRVSLPLAWTVTLDGSKLLGNGAEILTFPDEPIPTNTVWLIGEFEFCSDGGAVMQRKTAHRVRLKPNEADFNYFNGLVYGSYDEQAASFPKTILNTVSKYHPLKGKLLDVGCATGLMVEYAQAQGLDAEGVDYSAWAVDQARRRTGGRCRQLSFDEATAADFDSTYDIITMHSVLEHLADPERAMQLLFKLCRPGGVVYVETLNADSLMHSIMGEDWGGYTDYTHKSHWLTADWIADTATRIGFEAVSIKRSMVWNDNVYDDVWQGFAQLIQLYPASILLEEQFGDIVEVILRRPKRQ